MQPSPRNDEALPVLFAAIRPQKPPKKRSRTGKSVPMMYLFQVIRQVLVDEVRTRDMADLLHRMRTMASLQIFRRSPILLSNVLIPAPVKLGEQSATRHDLDVKRVPRET